MRGAHRIIVESRKVKYDFVVKEISPFLQEIVVLEKQY